MIQKYFLLYIYKSKILMISFVCMIVEDCVTNLQENWQKINTLVFKVVKSCSLSVNEQPFLFGNCIRSYCYRKYIYNMSWRIEITFITLCRLTFFQDKCILEFP